MAGGMVDGIKGYLQLASGLSAVTRQRAMDVARSMMPIGEAPTEQVARLADDLLSTSRANRAAMTTLVRGEVDRALGRLGLAGRDDVVQIEERLRKVERQLRDLRTAVDRQAPPAEAPSQATPPPARTRRPKQPAGEAE